MIEDTTDPSLVATLVEKRDLTALKAPISMVCIGR